MTPPYASPVPSPRIDMSRARLMIGGGRDGSEMAELDDYFGSWMVGGGKVIFLTWAIEDNVDVQGEFDAIKNAVARHGGAGVETWAEQDIARIGSDADISGFDGIYICGGNTYVLLDRMRKTGLDRALAEAASYGFAIYGISAGALVQGASIEPASLYGDQNDPAMTDFSALNVASSPTGAPAIFLPHFQDNLGDEAKRIVRESGLPVAGVPDGGAWIIEGGAGRSLGQDDVRWFGLELARLPSFERSAGDASRQANASRPTPDE